MPRAKANSGWYVANTTFLVDDYVQVVKNVTRVREGAAVMKGREEFFTPIEDMPHHAPVEQATSAPGEKREKVSPSGSDLRG